MAGGGLEMPCSTPSAERVSCRDSRDVGINRSCVSTVAPFRSARAPCGLLAEFRRGGGEHTERKRFADCRTGIRTCPSLEYSRLRGPFPSAIELDLNAR